MNLEVRRPSRTEDGAPPGSPLSWQQVEGPGEEGPGGEAVTPAPKEAVSWMCSPSPTLPRRESDHAGTWGHPPFPGQLVEGGVSQEQGRVDPGREVRGPHWDELRHPLTLAWAWTAPQPWAGDPDSLSRHLVVDKPVEVAFALPLLHGPPHALLQRHRGLQAGQGPQHRAASHGVRAQGSGLHGIQAPPPGQQSAPPPTHVAQSWQVTARSSHPGWPRPHPCPGAQLTIPWPPRQGCRAGLGARSSWPLPFTTTVLTFRGQTRSPVLRGKGRPPEFRRDPEATERQAGASP